MCLHYLSLSPHYRYSWNCFVLAHLRWKKLCWTCANQSSKQLWSEPTQTPGSGAFMLLSVCDFVHDLKVPQHILQLLCQMSSCCIDSLKDQKSSKVSLYSCTMCKCASTINDFKIVWWRWWGGCCICFFIVESFLEVILPRMCSLIHMPAKCICRFLSCLFSWLVKAVLYFIIENRKFKFFYNNNFYPHPYWWLMPTCVWHYTSEHDIHFGFVTAKDWKIKL